MFFSPYARTRAHARAREGKTTHDVRGLSAGRVPSVPPVPSPDAAGGHRGRNVPVPPYYEAMTDAALLLVYALAVARITGLITTDTITEPARDALIGWLDDRPKTLGAFIATLITCPWCASVWVAMVAAPLVWFWGYQPALLIPALALAFSQATGMISTLGR